MPPSKSAQWLKGRLFLTVAVGTARGISRPAATASSSGRRAAPRVHREEGNPQDQRWERRLESSRSGCARGYGGAEG